jgi:S-adenosylmethionine decarboxylase
VTPGAYRPAGSHLLADLHGVEEGKLCDASAIETLLRQSAQAAGAHVLESRFHSFGTGKGVTGVVLLAESHITIHTWPECGFAAADIFMCGNAEPQRALDVVLAALQPASTEMRTIARGMAAETV